MDLGNSTGDIVASYKGFKVNIDTYLYQLVWDEETATKFYTQYYTDKDNKEKVNAFNNNRKMFKLKYVAASIVMEVTLPFWVLTWTSPANGAKGMPNVAN